MATNITTEETGWIPVPTVKSIYYDINEIDVSEERPQRLQQKLKDRKLLQKLARVLPQIKDLESQKNFKMESGSSFDMLLDEDYIIPANSSMYVKIHPSKRTSKFLICQPLEDMLTEKLDIINGSYHEAHGGILMVHNYNDQDLSLSKIRN